ncbi:hypothetical protein ACFV98_11860 [Streptomyces violascens]|uniref:hypothetical protein n=1 Tax=Streptomyces violascens TaxID=67381 RepID=UPI003646985C
MKKQLAELRVNDHVRAEGVDTRGQQVVRVGDLLAPPKDVTAQRNGHRAKGWRLFVGLAGTSVTERATWVTIFPDAGSVEKVSRPKVGEWQNTELRLVPGVRASSKMAFHFGGKGGKRSTEPVEPVVLAGITYVGDGRYEIRDQDTGDVLLTCTLQSQIWWATAPPAAMESEPAGQGQGESSAPQLSVVADTLPEEDDDLRRPVHHVATGEVVGYLREPHDGECWKWTSIEKEQR